MAFQIVVEYNVNKDLLWHALETSILFFNKARCLETTVEEFGLQQGQATKLAAK